MSITPLQDWVVVEQDPAEEFSIGGLIIPGSAQKKQEQGRVVSVGKGKYVEEKQPGKKSKSKTKAKANKKFVPTTLQVGNHILYEKWSAHEIEVDGVDYILVREEDVLGLLDQ